ncbi:hypothetical protein [Streptomyces sp. NPDC054887]
MSLRLITNELDAYEAERAARLRAAQDAYEAELELITRYEIAVGVGDQVGIRSAKKAIEDHDRVHGSQLLAELAAA